MNHKLLLQNVPQHNWSRRHFLSGSLSIAAAAPLFGAMSGFAAENAAARAPSGSSKRKIKLGIVGCGIRGGWIGKFFQQHGGYEILAVADYFQPVADKCGKELGVHERRRFSGLSGYKKVIESGIEAVGLFVPPCFFPEQVEAAVAAGLHVYMAKPVAVDVPGCRRIEAAGKLATKKRQVLLVDFQMPTDPVNIEVAKRIHSAEMGKIVKVTSICVSPANDDPPLTANIESRLQNEIWCSDIALGGSYILSEDIHPIDAALWIIGQRPLAAMGSSRIGRAAPHGDAHDVCSVIFEYADGLIYEHSGQIMSNGFDSEYACKVCGQAAHAVVNYLHKAHFHRRGAEPIIDAEVVNLYEAGAVRNITAFHQAVSRGKFENPTVKRAVDGCLTAILGREAGLRHGRLTMEDLLKTNRRIEVDLRGLKG
jgi:myo-inositol 2-dehydrogenase / D-chiro-inositol 1-dehydrogenase